MRYGERPARRYNSTNILRDVTGNCDVGRVKEASASGLRAGLCVVSIGGDVWRAALNSSVKKFTSKPLGRGHGLPMHKDRDLSWVAHPVRRCFDQNVDGHHFASRPVAPCDAKYGRPLFLPRQETHLHPHVPRFAATLAQRVRERVDTRQGRLKPARSLRCEPNFRLTPLAYFRSFRLPQPHARPIANLLSCRVPGPASSPSRSPIKKTFANLPKTARSPSRNSGHELAEPFRERNCRRLRCFPQSLLFRLSPSLSPSALWRFGSTRAKLGAVDAKVRPRTIADALGRKILAPDYS